MTQSQQTPSRSQAALRRLLIVLAVAAGIVVYAYGWEVTDISLAPTQDPIRQESVGRALRELLSPNIFTQTRELRATEAFFTFDCDAGEAPATTPSDGIFVVISPACGSPRDQLTVTGFNFDANVDVEFRLVIEGGQPRPLGEVLTDNNGEFETQIVVPNIRGVQPGTLATVEVRALLPVGTPRFSTTTNLVIEKIIETIFLALMATTLALPISVVLSFLAAHNLMKPIKMPVGKALMGLALIPAGYWLGAALLGAVGAFGFNLGSGSLLGLAVPGLVVLGSVVASRASARMGLEGGGAAQARGVLVAIIVAIVAIFLIGVLGGISILLGQQMLRMEAVPLVGYLGNFINTLGELIELTIVPLAGVVGAFVLMNAGMRFVSPLLRTFSPLVSHTFGAVLGAVGAALVMMAAAVFGSEFALLTLLTPLIAGLLGGQIPVMIYDRVLNKTSLLNRTTTDRLIRTLLRFGAFLGVAFFTYEYFNISRSIVEGRLPVVDFYITWSAVFGAVLGGLVGGLSGVQASMPLGDVIYNITRTVLNALRSIEPLIMGIVFVIWVGIGPFAGVLALTLHSIASLGKLYSEQIENIDHGPIEALQATGANQIQTIIYAVVPQIIPPYIAFTLYRWDINVRMSTIIGFVGGGGVGFLLQQQINLLRYRDAGVAVLAIAIVVSILDYASASIRERVM
ncbi:MAG: ABC transporter permease subunit [Aggregatilineales bacterium]